METIAFRQRHDHQAGITTKHHIISNMAKNMRKRSGLLGTISACISLTMVLILLGSVVMFVTMAMNFSQSVRENFTVEVLLDDSISNQELASLKNELQRMPYTKQVNYISKEQGTQEMMADLGNSPDDMLDASPIPAEYEVFLKADYTNSDSLARYMPELEKKACVKEVVYPVDLMDTMTHTIRIVSTVLLAVAALFVFVSFVLINNTMGLLIHTRRFSIRTMKLVGAKWSFIRRPFMMRGLRIAIVSALLAGGALMAGMQALVRFNDNSQFDVVTPTVMGLTLGSVVVASLVVTLFCTLISVNRHLRMSDDKLFTK